MMAENWETPNMPKLDTGKVPPLDSSGFSLPSFACSPARMQASVMHDQSHMKMTWAMLSLLHTSLGDLQRMLACCHAVMQ